MSDNEIRLAIAKACGWTWKATNKIELGADEPTKAWFAPDGIHRYGQVPPDYVNDLNAMNDACKQCLTESWQVTSFNQILIMVCKMQVSAAFNATARQRAEAFLRCLGKWKESDVPTPL